ncbi:MAG: RNA polymerase sigma factor [Planctomycetota bacterium]|jgi:RNA polymerase sigma-70 factor (ECF subfamily)
MICWIFPGRIAVLRVERLLDAVVCVLADSAATARDGSRAASPTAAELEDVRQSRQGDSDAYRCLIERNQEHVGRMLWRFSRDRTVHEELVQDVFVEAYMSLRSYRGKAPFAHWLSRIATRVGYRHWRQMARRHKTENFSLQEWDRIAEPEEPAPEETDPATAASLVHRLLAQLPPRDRLVLTLRYLEGCNVAETAHRTGWTKAMVKVQSLRARKKLEKLLAQTGKELER